METLTVAEVGINQSIKLYKRSSKGTDGQCRREQNWVTVDTQQQQTDTNQPIGWAQPLKFRFIETRRIRVAIVCNQRLGHSISHMIPENI
jgi:hypothetical protein